MECPGVFCCPAHEGPEFNTNPHNRTIPRHETRCTLCFTQLRSLETEVRLVLRDEFWHNCGVPEPPKTDGAKQRPNDADWHKRAAHQTCVAHLLRRCRQVAADHPH